MLRSLRIVMCVARLLKVSGFLPAFAPLPRMGVTLFSCCEAPAKSRSAGMLCVSIWKPMLHLSRFLGLSRFDVSQ